MVRGLKDKLFSWMHRGEALEMLNRPRSVIGNPGVNVRPLGLEEGVVIVLV